MFEKIENRLTELKEEFESGRKMMADLEAKKTDLQATMLRISGAVQVLEELLAGEKEENPGEACKKENQTPE